MTTELDPIRTVVRLGRDADRGFIVALSEEAFRPYARNASVNALRMMRGDAGVLVAEEAGTRRRLGFAIVRLEALGRPFGPWPKPHVGHLDAIAVREDLHGRGVGRVLLESAEAHVLERHAVSMSLLTAKTNTRARMLFETSGYRAMMPVLGAYIERQDALYMRKALFTGV